MILIIVFTHEFEADMKKQFDSFSNPLEIYGVRTVYMTEGMLHSVIWDDRMFNMKNISQFYVTEEGSRHAEN